MTQSNHQLRNTALRDPLWSSTVRAAQLLTDPAQTQFMSFCIRQKTQTNPQSDEQDDKLAHEEDTQMSHTDRTHRQGKPSYKIRLTNGSVWKCSNFPNQ